MRLDISCTPRPKWRYSGRQIQSEGSRSSIPSPRTRYGLKYDAIIPTGRSPSYASIISPPSNSQYRHWRILLATSSLQLRCHNLEIVNWLMLGRTPRLVCLWHSLLTVQAANDQQNSSATL